MDEAEISDETHHGSDQTSTRLAETSQQPAENDAAEQALFERAHKQAEHDDQRQLQGPVGHHPLVFIAVPSRTNTAHDQRYDQRGR